MSEEVDHEENLEEESQEESQEEKHIVSILSIDIGTINLGYTIITYDDNDKVDPKDLDIDFSIYTIDDGGKGDTVAKRYKSISKFYDRVNFLISQKKSTLKNVIIEKQVGTNKVAMCLMYALFVKASDMIGVENVSLFDPKLKFTTLNTTYDTKNKSHKKKSILYAKEFLMNTHHKDDFNTFLTFIKLDDIADSLNQAIIWMFLQNQLTCDKDRLCKLYKILEDK